MLQVTELQAISQDRLADAQVLLSAQRFDGAVYLCGYSVELALKARICLTLGWSGFPETNSEFQGIQSLKTHDLEILLRFSGVEGPLRARHLREWSVILTWNPSKRYRRPGRSTVQEATTMISAATTLVGVL